MSLKGTPLWLTIFFLVMLAICPPSQGDEYQPLVIEVGAYQSEPGTLTYKIKPGDTLFSICRKHNVEVSLVSALNDITNANKIKSGQEIIIPLELSFDTPVVVTTGSVKERNVSIQSVGSRVSSRTNNGFMMVPTTGVISSLFGPRKGEFHTGLDIANDLGTPIYAAQSGKVIFTGWRGNYGRAVIIDHMNGYQTLYGHNSKIIIKSGQIVKAGQLISQMGSTGRSTGPHLHFEVYHNNKVVNPIEYISR